MFSEDDRRRDARQDLLEAIASGMTGPVCGPMPGSIFETMEVAAASRWCEGIAAVPPAAAALTAPANGSPMMAILLRLGGVVGNVAFRIRTGSGARRLPV